MKKMFLIIIALVGIVLGAFTGFRAYAKNNTIVLKSSGYEYINDYVMETPKFNEVSGSWWGHNQYKLASIGQTLFYIEYDNSALEFGNSSSDNPFTCSFKIINDEETNEIDKEPCNSPGIVLSDETNNRIYFILVEPTGAANNGGYGWTGISTTFMYEYSYNQDTFETSFVTKHQVTESLSDGKIRQGADIDEDGNIAIAYGDYSGYIQLYIFNYVTREWVHSSHLSNPDNDTLMYCNTQIIDLDNVYVLCQQDTAKNGRVLYQYVKFFTYEENVWKDKMIVDYRHHELADQEDTLVMNSDLLVIDNKVHIVTTAQNFHEIIHLVYDNGTYSSMDTTVLPSNTENIKLVEYDNEWYYVIYRRKYTIRAIDIFSSVSQDTVFSMIGVPNKQYIYPIAVNNNKLYLLMYPNNNESGVLFELKHLEN